MAGRRFGADEWLQFLISDPVFHEHGISDALESFQDAFNERICDMLDEMSDEHPDLAYNEYDPGCTLDECVWNTAYLTFATFAEHGIGLWEDREPWHRLFWERVKTDPVLCRIVDDIDNEGTACHLLKTDGDPACGHVDHGGDVVWMEADINMVTCPVCLSIHEEWEDGQEE
jgi:hypothetical protein